MAQDMSSTGDPASDELQSDGITAPSLVHRIAVTLAVVVVARLGLLIPLPGLNIAAWNEFFAHSSSPLVPSTMSVFTLGVTPIFSALVLVEMMMLVFPALRRIKADPANRRTFERSTLIVALTMAAFQAWGMALALQDISGVVAEPGFAFRATCVASMVGATAVLSCLASIITRHGIGSGIWVLLVAAHLEAFAFAGPNIFDLIRTGAVAAELVPLPILFVAASAWALIALERANPGLARDEAYVWPPILASVTAGWILLEIFVFEGPSQVDEIPNPMDAGHLAHVATMLCLVPLFTFWRLRSLKANDPKSAQAATPILAGIVLTMIVLAGEALSAWLPIPGLPAGEMVIIAVSIALSLSGFVPSRRSAGVVS